MSRLDAREGIGSNLSLLLHHATRNVPGVREFQGAPSCAEPLGWIKGAFHPSKAGACIDLLSHLGASASSDEPPIAAALAQRQSTRSYSERPLTLNDVARFLHWAYPAQVRTPGDAPSAQPHRTLQAWNGHVTMVRQVMLALRVDGLAPGAYLVDEQNLTLVQLNADATRIPDLLETACFQAEFRSAASLFLMVGSLADAIERYGDRGYRYMLLEDGVQLQRNGIACAALGFAGSITASFSQDSWDGWLGLDGFHASVLNGYALGHSERPKALAAAMAQASQKAVHASE
ncbi:SagB/ThcOx family dehydrogenase [Massilia frigida]|nr:SagB/ThcOx family dehydrogenase [Massilia frigida]